MCANGRLILELFNISSTKTLRKFRICQAPISPRANFTRAKMRGNIQKSSKGRKGIRADNPRAKRLPRTEDTNTSHILTPDSRRSSLCSIIEHSPNHNVSNLTHSAIAKCSITEHDIPKQPVTRKASRERSYSDLSSR